MFSSVRDTTCGLQIAAAAGRQRGFSLIELLIAMVVTLAVFAITSAFVAAAFNVRRREDDRTDALAAARRALSVMTREIADAGFDLPRGQGFPANGLVAAQSGPTSVRFLSNRGGANDLSPSDPGEDVLFQLAADPAGGRGLVLRHDYNAPAPDQNSILADSIDGLTIRYFDGPVGYEETDCDIEVTSPDAAEVADLAAARFVVVSMCVSLPAAGAPGSAGFQPASRVQLTSATALRNASLTTY